MSCWGRRPANQPARQPPAAASCRAMAAFGAAHSRWQACAAEERRGLEGGGAVWRRLWRQGGSGPDRACFEQHRHITILLGLLAALPVGEQRHGFGSTGRAGTTANSHQRGVAFLEFVSFSSLDDAQPIAVSHNPCRLQLAVRNLIAHP